MEELAATLKKKNAPIKPVLLDQATVAGIGNWIVDEVMFQSKIHPEKKSNQLTDNEIITIHQTINSVIKMAIEFQANYDKLPRNFLIHARGWGSKTDVNLGKCPECSEPISIIKVGGRTTFFCKNRQAFNT